MYVFPTNINDMLKNLLSPIFFLSSFLLHLLVCQIRALNMDDFIILLPDKNSCIKLMNMISDFWAKKLRLELNDKSRYFPNKMGVNFCGYRIFHTHRLLRNSSKKKIKRNVKKWNKKYKCNTLNIPHTLQRINSWLGHSSYCNSYRLQQKILNKCDFLFTDKTHSKLENNLLENF